LLPALITCYFSNVGNLHSIFLNVHVYYLVKFSITFLPDWCPISKTCKVLPTKNIKLSGWFHWVTAVFLSPYPYHFATVSHIASQKVPTIEVICPPSSFSHMTYCRAWVER
jgi:hypothetical protein